MVPTQSATVLVALAAMGATPLNRSAGKAMKLPPPATALSAPPSTPATKRKRMVCSAKYQVVPQRRKKEWSGGPLPTTEVLACHRFIDNGLPRDKNHILGAISPLG